MSQQHIQFEEEFRDDPPNTIYQNGYTGPQSVSSPYTQASAVGQKLLPPSDNGSVPSPALRLALAIVSLVFVFLTFMVALLVIGFRSTANYFSPVAGVALLFALLFAGFALVINLIFNNKR